MTIDMLINIIDSGREEAKNYIYLLNTITDWSIEVDSVEEYFFSVKSFLGIEKLNLNLLRSKNKEYSGNQHIWEMESISELILFLEIEEKKNEPRTKAKSISTISR